MASRQFSLLQRSNIDCEIRQTSCFFRQYGVVPSPDIFEMQAASQDDCIVLATDGYAAGRTDNSQASLCLLWAASVSRQCAFS
jgi:hypothetical protein